MTAGPAAGRVPARAAAPRLPRVTGWTVGVLALALLLTSPILAVLGIAMEGSGDAWPHLGATVLGNYVSQTLCLVLGVGVGVLLLGVSTAWLVTMFEFPGRSVLQWALLLPLAMPSYIAAYTYTDLLEFAGPLQTGLRQLFGWQSPRDYWFPEVRSLGGAVTFLSLVLYPYVYLLARSAFVDQSQSLWDAARGLGLGTWSCFARVALPRNVITLQVEMVRREGYGMLRGLRLEGKSLDRFSRFLTGAAADTFLVQEDAPGASCTIGELKDHFQGRTSVLALVRDGASVESPPMDYRLRPHDILVLLGSHADLDRAVQLLTAPAPDEEEG